MQVELLGTPPPQSKGSRIFPGSSQGNFAPFPPPPQLRDPAQPQNSGHHAFNIIQRAPCRQGRCTLSEAQGLPVFSFQAIFYLLGIKIEVYCAQFIIRQKFLEVNPEWPIGLDLLQVTRCNVHGSPLPWKLTAKFPLETVVLVFLFPPASSGMNFPSGVQIRDIIKMDWIK